jgi:hypothetical protein
MTDRDMEELTGGWVPQLPKAYEKSVVLGGGRNLFPCPDPETTAKVLSEHIAEVARRAYRQGKKDAKAEIRKAIFE